ncbi:MAG: FecR family protein [Chthoniobacteraceae bacterium]
MNKFLLASIASITAIAPHAHSKGIPLEEATITRTVNDVRVLDPKKGTAPARVSQVIKDDMGVKTGIKSRAELLFQDNTLTRLGAESYFTFRPGTREMSLDSGTMLLQVPKGHGGATIRSASVTASITGTTILLENLPGKSVKVCVLEGSLRLAMNNRRGETISLRAGSMIIHKPGDKSLPEPVKIDIRRLIQSSSLVNPELFNAKNKPAPLPSMPLIAAAIGEQDRQRAKGNLQDTNLVILGKGTKVVAASRETMKVLAGIAVPTDSAASGGNETVRTLSMNSGAFSPGAGSGGTLQNTQAAASTFAATAPNVDGRKQSIGKSGQPYPGDVDIKSPVDVSTATHPAGAKPRGIGGIFNIFTTEKALVDTKVEVSSNSPNRMSATGGSIRIESLKPNSGTGIEITNTSQLLSLLNASAPGPGGKIELVTSGSKIQIGGKIQADRGLIAVTNNGLGGEIRIDQATLSANVIKVGALQADGVLRIGNSRLSADNLLSLYGGSGSGGVRFTDNTLLDARWSPSAAGPQPSSQTSRTTQVPAAATGARPDGSSARRRRGSPTRHRSSPTRIDPDPATNCNGKRADDLQTCPAQRRRTSRQQPALCRAAGRYRQRVRRRRGSLPL